MSYLAFRERFFLATPSLRGFSTPAAASICICRELGLGSRLKWMRPKDSRRSDQPFIAEMVWLASIPILVSLFSSSLWMIRASMTTSTDLAVEIAETANLTLVGRLLNATPVILCGENRILSHRGEQKL